MCENNKLSVCSVNNMLTKLTSKPESICRFAQICQITSYGRRSVEHYPRVTASYCWPPHGVVIVPSNSCAQRIAKKRRHQVIH